MKYHLIASIRGNLCQECTLPFHHSVLRAFRVRESLDVPTRGPQKDVVGEIKAQDLEALQGQAIGQVTLDAEGRGVLIAHESSGYAGEPLLLVLEVPFLDPMSKPEQRRATRYLSLGTTTPQWSTQDQRIATAPFSACLPERIVLLLLEYFDVWIISGKVNVCSERGLPISPAGGLTVTAIDNDWLKDDALGTATTDAQGRFRIAYRSADVKKTPLSPIINVETLGSAGPDIYFVVKAGNTVLLEEDPDRGLQPDRKDVGRIACVQLCIPGQGGGTVVPSVWIGVGKHKISTQGNPQAFDANGYLDPDSSANLWAITRSPSLVGTAPNPLDPAGLQEYRFLYSLVTGDNTQAALNPSTFTPYVPADGFVVEVGTLYRVAPFKTAVVFLTKAHIDPSEGWVNLRKALEDAVTNTPGLSVADLSDPAQTWVFSGNSILMRLDTTRLNTGGSRPEVSLQPGSLYVGAAAPVEKVALRFEVRSQGSNVPGINNGLTLNAMVINNDAMSVDIGMQNAAGGNMECTIFNQEPPFLAYSLFHPYLLNATVELRKGSGPSVNVGSISVPTNSDRVAGKFDLSPFLSGTCSYIAKLNWALRLSDGQFNIGDDESTSFYYEA